MTTQAQKLGIVERITKWVTGAQEEAGVVVPLEKRAIMSNDDLPENVLAALPEDDARSTWRRSFNSTYIDDDYNEARATASAWESMRWNGYRKTDDGTDQLVKSAKPSIVVVKARPDERYTLGVVYAPDELDTDGDFATAEDIRKAAHEFIVGRQIGTYHDVLHQVGAALLKAEGGEVEINMDVLEEAISKTSGLNDEHNNTEFDHTLGDIVESYVAPSDMEIGGQPISKGTWLLGVVWSEKQWGLVKSGERTGYSMEGTAHAVDVEDAA